MLAPTPSPRLAGHRDVWAGQAVALARPASPCSQISRPQWRGPSQPARQGRGAGSSRKIGKPVVAAVNYAGTRPVKRLRPRLRAGAVHPLLAWIALTPIAGRSLTRAPHPGPGEIQQLRPAADQAFRCDQGQPPAQLFL